jgi:hypothetical protein
MIKTDISPITQNGRNSADPSDPSRAQHFMERMRASLREDMRRAVTRTIAKHENVYTCGDHDAMVYVIEHGRIKLVVKSHRETVPAGYLRGGRYLRGALSRGRQRASGKRPPRWKRRLPEQIPCSQFLLRLSQDTRLEGFVRYLAVRIADQQQVITNLVTVDSERRLARTLLHWPRSSANPIRTAFRIVHQFPHTERPRW